MGGINMRTNVKQSSGLKNVLPKSPDYDLPRHVVTGETPPYVTRGEFARMTTPEVWSPTIEPVKLQASKMYWAKAN